MFKSKEVVRGVKYFAEEHKIPLSDICVGGGAALLLMGLRGGTRDLNLWVDSPYFERLAEQHGVINHPMVDTVVEIVIDAGGIMNTICPFTVWVRQRNRYFKHDEIDGLNVFDPLALLIQKRGGYSEHRRPQAKRDQDLIDIRKLNDVLSKRNQIAA